MILNCHIDDAKTWWPVTDSCGIHGELLGEIERIMHLGKVYFVAWREGEKLGQSRSLEACLDLIEAAVRREWEAQP